MGRLCAGVWVIKRGEGLCMGLGWVGFVHSVSVSCLSRTSYFLFFSCSMMMSERYVPSFFDVIMMGWKKGV